MSTPSALLVEHGPLYLYHT